MRTERGRRVSQIREPGRGVGAGVVVAAIIHHLVDGKGELGPENVSGDAPPRQRGARPVLADDAGEFAVDQLSGLGRDPLGLDVGDCELV